MQLPVAIELVPPHPLSFRRRVHRQAIGQLGTVDRLARLACLLQLLQPRRLFGHQPQQRRPRAGRVGGQPLPVGQLVQELTAAFFDQRRVALDVVLLQQAFSIRGLHEQGPLPSQLGRRDHLLDVPAPVLFQAGTEPVPAFEQPLASVGGGLNAVQDNQRLAPAGLEGGMTVGREEREQVRDGVLLGFHGAGHQPVAQCAQLLLLVVLRVSLGGPDGRGHPRGLDPLGPFDSRGSIPEGHP